MTMLGNLKIITHYLNDMASGAISEMKRKSLLKQDGPSRGWTVLNVEKVMLIMDVKNMIDMAYKSW